MESRKDINRNRFIFFNVGLIISCSFVLWAFQWNPPERKSLIEATIHTPEEIQVMATWTPPKEEKKQEQKEPELDKNVDYSDRTKLVIEDLAPKPRKMITDLNPIRKDDRPVKLILPLVDDAPILAPDVRPSFPGGNAALKKFLEANLRYPERALDDGITGKVVVKFVVDANGNIEDIRILKSELGPEGSREALRVMQLMPKWIPGYYKGKKVSSFFIQKFAFELM